MGVAVVRNSQGRKERINGYSLEVDTFVAVPPLLPHGRFATVVPNRVLTDGLPQCTAHRIAANEIRYSRTKSITNYSVAT